MMRVRLYRKYMDAVSKIEYKQKMYMVDLSKSHLISLTCNHRGNIYDSGILGINPNQLKMAVELKKKELIYFIKQDTGEIVRL